MIIDIKKGNILKIDRHKYVRKAYHGLTELSTRTRKSIYTKQVTTYTDKDYVNIDTIFLLIDALLFSYLVDLKKKTDFLDDKTFEDMYRDVRMAVDLCHKDGIIKDSVMENPSKYIIYDEALVPLLIQLKSSGKKIFLLTNSLWEYTDKVMEYLVHAKGNYKNFHWKDLFDAVIVGASKPSFLINEYLPLFKVDEDGYLSNIEDKDMLSPNYLQAEGTVFQG